MKKKKLDLDYIHREVKRLDPKLGEHTDTFATAVCLLAAALVVGPNVRRVARFTGYHVPFVKSRFERLRKQGVIRRGKFNVEWDHKTEGGVAFWMDVCVAEGIMDRVQQKP